MATIRMMRARTNLMKYNNKNNNKITQSRYRAKDKIIIFKI